MTRPSASLLRRLAIAVLLLVLATLAIQIAVGGFRVDVFGLRLSSNSLVRPIVALLLVAAFLFHPSRRGAVLADLRRVDALLDRAAPAIAVGAAASAFAIGLVWGTRAAGGSDSYCYIGQAVEFAHGRTNLVEPLAERLPIPRASLVFAPVGFIPGAHGGAVPMCAPGLSLLLAPAWKFAGDAGLHTVVPALGALAVWLTFVVGRRLQDRTTGACAAVLLCASPIFLYQIVQPMSDVPAAAFWSAAVALLTRNGASRPFAGGLVAAIALLVRPNLAPVLIPLVAFVFRISRARGMLQFFAGLAPGGALLLWVNHTRYGSPFRTGYGDAEDLFSASHVLPNVTRYMEWILASQTPLILLTFAAPLIVRAYRDRFTAWHGAFIWTALGFVLFAFGCYLPYSVFDAWWYTRFLLPALPFMLVLTSFTVVLLSSFAPARSLLLVPLLAGVVASYVSYARSHETFALRDFERRYVSAGTLVGRTLPANAVVITIQQSGAVRYYGGRPAALWDAIAPDALDETVTLFEGAGLHPYLLLEEGELAGFRDRFRGERLGALDWRPAAVVTDRVTVTLYDAAQR